MIFNIPSLADSRLPLLILFLVNKVMVMNLILSESFIAGRACQEGELLLSMCQHVFVEVAFLSEGVFTAFHETDEGLLLEVRSQVIEKVVPLLEDAGASTLVLAEECLDPPLALNFEVFYEHKVTHLRDRNRPF